MKDKDTNRAFIVPSNKIEKFLSTKMHSDNDAINRIKNRNKNK